MSTVLGACIGSPRVGSSAVQLNANNSKDNTVAAQGFEEHHGAPRSLAQQMPEHTTAKLTLHPAHR